MRLGGVLWISSDSDDQIMVAKIKDPKNFPGQFQQNPKKSLALKLTLLYGKNYVKLMQKVIILMQNVIKNLMQNVLIFQLKI